MVTLFYSSESVFKYEAVYLEDMNNSLQAENLVFLHFKNTYLFANSKQKLLYALTNGKCTGFVKMNQDSKKYIKTVHLELMDWLKECPYVCCKFESIKCLIRSLKKDKELKKIENLKHISANKSKFKKIGVF